RQCRLVPEDGAAVERHVASDVALPSEDGVGNRRLSADAAVGPEDGAFDNRPFLDLRLTPEHCVRSDTRTRLHEDTLVDEDRALDDDAVFDARVRRDTFPWRRDAAEWRRVEAAVHDVAMDLCGVLGRADVDPVAVVDVGDESLAALDASRGVN